MAVLSDFRDFWVTVLSEAKRQHPQLFEHRRCEFCGCSGASL